MTRTKSRYPFLVKHYIFTLDFSNSLISQTNFRLPWRFEILPYTNFSVIFSIDLDYRKQL